MDFIECIRAIRRHAVVIVVIVLAGLAAAAVYVAVAPAQFTSDGKLLLTPVAAVVPGVTQSPADLVAGNNLVIQQVGTYVQLASTPTVLQPVIDELGLDETPATLAKSVSVSAVGASAFIAVQATAATADGAASLANSVASQLSTQVKTLTTTAQSPVTISATLVERPVAPTSPSSPNLVLSVLVGLLGGVAVAFIIVVLAEVLNTRVRRARDLLSATDAGYLGRLARDRRLRRAPVADLDGPPSAFIDDLRSIRAKLVASAEGEGAPVFVVSSPTTQEGKSVVAANLATALAETGLRTSLVDANLRAPVLAAYFGTGTEKGFSDALGGGIPATDLAMTSPSESLQVIVSAPADRAGERLASARASDLLAAIRAGSDVVVIDAGSVLRPSDALELSGSSTGYVIVARAGRSRIDEVKSAVTAVRDVGARVYGVVLTDAPTRGADARD